MPREDLKGLMRSKASKVSDKPASLAASRVRRTRCRELALVGSSSCLALVAFDVWRLSEAGVGVMFVLVLLPGVV